MMRLRSDLVSLFIAVADQALAETEIEWCQETAMTVVLAAKGYPGSYKKGSVINGLDEAAAMEGVEIFHAGTARDDHRILAAGGRVLNVTALGQDVSQARRRAYAAIELIDWPQGFCRSDIGWRAIEREQAN